MPRLFPQTIRDYGAARDRLLARIASRLAEDATFCAAWLSGSLGRGAGDALSDLDVCVVVDDQAARDWCARPFVVSAGAPGPRRALFAKFGQMLNIHENHNNAPQGGTFSSVLYRKPGVIVDWTLVPRGMAYRPPETRPLFDRAGISAGQMPAASRLDFSGDDLTPAQREAERVAFFWLMAMVAAKYIRRGPAAQEEVEWVLPFMAGEIAGQLGPNTAAPDAAAPPEVRLRALCALVQAQFPHSAARAAAVEHLLNLQA